MPLCVVRDRRTAKGSECSRRTEAATTLRRSYSMVFYLPQLPSRDYQKLLPGMTLRSRPSQFYRAFYRAWFSVGASLYQIGCSASFSWMPFLIYPRRPTVTVASLPVPHPHWVHNSPGPPLPVSLVPPTPSSTQPLMNVSIGVRILAGAKPLPCVLDRWPNLCTICS